MDEKELQAVAEALEQLRQGSTVSAETLSKLSGTTQNTNKAFEKLSAGIVAYGRQISGAMSGLASGNGSFQGLAGSVDLLATSISKVAGNFGIIGKVIGGVATGIGEAAKVALKQLDDITSNYQALGDASAGAADGIDGLYRQFNQLGNYSLPAFTKAVKANMSGLLAFKGTAAEGAEELSLVAGALTKGDVARGFLKVGMTLDGVGDAAANYTAAFGRMGLTQGDTTEELTKKTKNYIYEVDQIARLTGQSREAQQKAQQQTLADARARAVLGEMARHGEKDAAKQLSNLMSAFDESTNAAIRANATGIPLTEQAQKANLYTNDQIRQTTLAVKRGEIDAVEGAARIRRALAAGAERFGTQVSYAGDVFGGVAVAGEDASATLASVAELKKKKEYAGLSDAELVKKAQELQRDASGTLTEDITDASLAAAGAGKNIQRLSFSLAQVATGPLKTFAEVLEKATGAVSNKYGVGGTSMNRPGVNHGTPGGPAAAAAAGVDPGRSVTIGSEKRMGGDRNWRNNNPGNIEYGPFAQSMGAVGTDGRFAIFPTLEMGRKAADTLLKGKNYANLSAADALKKWAPETENNIQAYASNMASQGVDLNKRYSDLTPAEQAKFLDAMTRVEGGHAGTVTGADPNAPSIAGPTSGYKTAVTATPASASAGADTAAHATRGQGKHHTESAFEMFGKKLDQLVALQHQNNAQNSKLLQATKAG
jgi:hypothetical protein